MNKIIIIVPTYNERENIDRLIEVLEREIFPQIKKHQMAILVVDDKSPDGTADVVREKMKKYDNLYLSSGEKKGLGAAYLRGMKHAMDKLNAAAVVEFDADFQHDPEHIIDLVKKFDQGFNHIIGSRYIPGGGVPDDWGLGRKILSFFGGLYTRAVLFLPDFKKFKLVTDPSTGLKLTKTKGVLDQLDFGQIGLGFYYKTQMLYQLVNRGVKVGEIPIRFHARKKGESKMPFSNIVNTFKEVTLMRLREPKTAQFVKFAVVGFIGYLVNASTLYLFGNVLAFAEWLAWGLSTELAIISNFTWNNLWTFKQAKITKLTKLIKKFLEFNLTSAGALLIQTTTGTIGVKILGPQYRQILLPFIIVFLVLPYNYLMYTHVIWRVAGKKKKV